MDCLDLPRSDAGRERTLRALNMIDTPRDPVLDGLVRSAAALTGSPMAVISLADGDRQWFKARFGLDATEGPLEACLCAATMLGDTLLEVHDASQDARFAGSPFVSGGGGIRHYAGVPLLVAGSNIGTLGVAGPEPRALSPEQKALLHDLGQAVEHWMRSQLDRNELRQVLVDRESLFENMAEGVLLIDRDNHLLDANPAVLKMLRTSKEELLRRGLADVLGEQEHGRLDHITQLRRARLADLQTWVAVRADGTRFNAEVGVRPLDEQRLAVVVRDTTERQKQAQQQREELEALVAQRTHDLDQTRQQAESANRAKSEFLATMSHEIRTPMNGVVGIVDVLQQSSLTPYQADLVDTIRESSLALLGIIEDLLDFSKIEAGRLSLSTEPVHLRRLVDGVCETLQTMASHRSVAMRWYVDPALPERVDSDGLRLRQILLNLVGNAIKFSAGLEHQGRVVVRLEPDQAGQLRLRVSDNGIGMSPDVQARVFAPFEQAEPSTTRRYGGTGLGLSICQRLVDLFGGSIGITSVPQQGSTFTVQLPLKPCEPPATPASAPAQEPDLSGLKCHVFLRDQQLGQDWSRYLRDAGAEVCICDDWPVLLAAYERAGEEPCVVIAEHEQELEGIAAPEFAVVSVSEGALRSAVPVTPGLVSLAVNPLRRSNMLHAVALAAGRAQPMEDESAAEAHSPIAAPTVAHEALSSGRLVLVAEDNEINQKVIRRQLELLGYAVELTDDGGAALLRWRAGRAERGGQGRYGLLLTDLQMPGMDGYELARAIRDEEAGADPMPIVALTANASQGEVVRCKSAGMDDYLSKPVQLTRLAELVTRWLPQTPESAVWPGSEKPAPVPQPVNHLPVFDGEALAEQIGDEPGLLAEFRQRYLASAQATVEQILAAFESGDAKTGGDLAHRLKSSSRVVGAKRLGETCHALEMAVRASQDDVAQALVERLPADLAQLTERLLAPADAWPVEAHAVAAGGERAVLLLDDAPMDLQILQRQLGQLGVTGVTTCETGPAALQWLEGRDTSDMLVLLDLNMPGMDGVEFMRHLAKRRYAGVLSLVSGTDVRVLETASKLAQAYQLRVLGHLQKPVTVETLRTLVDGWHDVTPMGDASGVHIYSGPEIRRAVDSHELRLHYQPKVRLSDGAWVGVEALVRWQHPSDGLVMPDQFVPVAEANGLIDLLTRSVLRQALAAARNWRAAGLKLRVSVNVSMDNLAGLDFPEYVQEQAIDFGVPPEALVLEVTESRLATDARATADILTRLRLKQFGLSIDDFGTGHCSLAQLRDIPFDELKIDRSFVHGSANSSTQQAIYAASLEMAHELGMVVVAEGVETRADWDFVRASGCDLAQGHFVAPPMPGEALAEWARLWAQRWPSLH